MDLQTYIIEFIPPFDHMKDEMRRYVLQALGILVGLGITPEGYKYKFKKVDEFGNKIFTLNIKVGEGSDFIFVYTFGKIGNMKKLLELKNKEGREKAAKQQSEDFEHWENLFTTTWKQFASKHVSHFWYGRHYISHC